jgi:hypothetical protein
MCAWMQVAVQAAGLTGSVGEAGGLWAWLTARRRESIQWQFIGSVYQSIFREMALACTHMPAS